MWKVSLYYDHKWDLIVIPDQKRCEWHNCGGVKVYRNMSGEHIALCFVDKEAFIVVDAKTNKLWALEDFEKDAINNGTESIMVKQDMLRTFNKDIICQIVSFVDEYDYILAYENMIVDLDLDFEKLNFVDCFKDSIWWMESVKNNKFHKKIESN